MARIPDSCLWWPLEMTVNFAWPDVRCFCWSNWADIVVEEMIFSVWQLYKVATWNDHCSDSYLCWPLERSSISIWPLNCQLSLLAHELSIISWHLLLFATWPYSCICWPLDLTVGSVGHLTWQLPLLATSTDSCLCWPLDLTVASVGHLTWKLYLLATWPDSWVCWPLDLTVASVDHFKWQLPLLLNELIAASVGHVNWPSLFSQLFGTNLLFYQFPLFFREFPQFGKCRHKIPCFVQNLSMHSVVLHVQLHISQCLARFTVNLPCFARFAVYFLCELLVFLHKYFASADVVSSNTSHARHQSCSRWILERDFFEKKIIKDCMNIIIRGKW